MSLILDALNRADQERSEQPAGNPMQPAPVAPAHNALPLRRYYREAIAGLLVLAAILGFYAWVNQSAQQPVQSARFIAPVPATPDSSNKTAVFTKLTPPTTSPSTASTPRPTKEPQPANTVQKTPAVDPAQRQAIADLYAQPQPSTPAPPAPKATTTPRLPAPAPRVERPKPTQASILQGIPLLAAMPPRFQQQVPSIEYSVHVYNDEDGSGAVNLNSRMYKVGAIIAPGLRVIAILPDSVVLDLNGTQFRLAALNSWMNFQ